MVFEEPHRAWYGVHSVANGSLHRCLVGHNHPTRRAERVSIFSSMVKIKGYPTVPSIWSWIKRFISTAYSMGSSLINGSMNPLTIMVLASGSVRPRLVK